MAFSPDQHPLVRKLDSIAGLAEKRQALLDLPMRVQVIEADQDIETAHPQQGPVRIRLLAALPPADFDLLRDSFAPVRLDLRQMVIEPKQPIRHVYFPQSGIVSILANSSEGRIEV